MKIDQKGFYSRKRGVGFEGGPQANIGHRGNGLAVNGGQGGIDTPRGDHSFRPDGKISGRDANGAPAAFAMDDFSTQPVPAAQQLGGIIDLPLRDQLPDAGGRNRLPVDFSRGDDLDFVPQGFTQLAQRRDISLATPP